MTEIVFNAPVPENSLESQVKNLQTTLASLNQQVIILQEALQKREQEITDLKAKLLQSVYTPAVSTIPSGKIDDTLTVVGAVIKLYQLVFPPGKVT